MPSSSALEGAGDFRVRLLWLTVFRTVATTLLLVVIAARLLSYAQEPSAADVVAFAVVGTVYLLTLVTGLLLRRGSLGAWAAWLHVVFDVVLASAVAALTGGLDSPFSFTFLVAIIGGGALLGRRGALVAATIGTAAWVLVSVFWSEAHDFVPWTRLALAGATQVLAQFLVAVLAGFLAEQLLKTGGQLSAREQDLRRLTELQDRIVNAMPSGLLTCDEAGFITYLNPAGASILGLEGPSRGLALEQVLPGAAQVRGSRRAVLGVPTPRGELSLGLSVTPLEPDSGALLIVFQDLTELRRLEAELARIDRLAVLGRVSAQLAHEIRNPLASIRGSAQLLGADIAEGSPSGRLAKLIIREADRLSGLVDNYLKLARPPPPALAPTRLDLVAAETVEILRADPSFRGASLEQKYEPIEARLDEAQVKQLLLNLLRNALAATGGRGPVRVTVHGRGNVPTLEVWDAAGSIPPEHQARLFEPFFSTHEGGTGLGLTTVQSIVQAHGGDVTFTSEPDRGTCFVVKFPPSPQGVPRVADPGRG